MDIVKEKDLAQSSAAQWIRALDSNGNPIKINADDLMALMSIASSAKKGLMPTGTLTPYIPGGVVLNDLSVITLNAIGLSHHVIGSNVPGAPNNNGGVLLRTQRSINSVFTTSQVVTDVMFDTNGSMFVRHSKGNGTMIVSGTWKQIPLNSI